MNFIYLELYYQWERYYSTPFNVVLLIFIGLFANLLNLLNFMVEAYL
jgi:hypothetical protein